MTFTTTHSIRRGASALARTVVVVATMLFATAAPALGSDANMHQNSNGAGVVYYDAAGGETNHVAVTSCGTGCVTITDAVPYIWSGWGWGMGYGCTTSTVSNPNGSWSTTCTHPNGIARVLVFTYDGDDDVTIGASAASSSRDVVVYGGAGNDTLVGGPFVDWLFGGGDADTLQGGGGCDGLNGGDGDDVLDGGTGPDMLVGANGFDRADYSQRTAPVFVKPDASVWQLCTGGGIGNDGESGEGDNVDPDVENIRGGQAGDSLFGDGGSNLLEGGPGDDLLDGDFGDDTLHGDGGSDRVFGGGNCDVVDGGPDGDFLEGGGGSDAFVGGSGIDTADYANRTGSVFVSLDATASSAPCGGGAIGNDGETGEGDNLDPDVENVWGGQAGDRLVGDAGRNVLVGGAGDDLLDGGLGPDNLFGEDGFDTITYAGRGADVTASLDGLANDGTFNEADNLMPGVEAIVGGGGNDKLTGDGMDNELRGGAGKDQLTGVGGNDKLFGEGEDDTINAQDGFFGDTVDCGSGADSATADYQTTVGFRGQPPTWRGDAVSGCEAVNWVWASPPIIKTFP